jgi:hypothetical protein
MGHGAHYLCNRVINFTECYFGKRKVVKCYVAYITFVKSFAQYLE